MISRFSRTPSAKSRISFRAMESSSLEQQKSSASTTRTFLLGDDPVTRARNFSCNMLRTTRYNVLTFLPVNLFEQFFFTPINVYFLFMSILQMVPQITLTAGVPTTGVPLTFVVLVAMIKDALEDYKRYVSDKSENERIAKRCTEGGLEEVKWQEIRVGDTLLIKNQDLIPADCMICTTSDTAGLAYVETANLDGETNLKVRTAPISAHSLFVESPTTSFSSQRVTRSCDMAAKDTQKWSRLQGLVEADKPNGSLGTFQGTMAITSLSHKIEKKSNSGMAWMCLPRRANAYDGATAQPVKPPLVVIPYEGVNVLLRGCKLRNTGWVVGKVIYTGKETKIQMNQTQKAKRKHTQIEGFVTRVLICLLIIQLIACGASTLVNTLWYSEDGFTLSYLFTLSLAEDDTGILLYFLYRFGTMMLLFMNFIPISLMVTMSMVKFLQAMFLGVDNTLEWKGFKCVPKTSDLNEELGQVEYVFSDKTGTLTQNLMEFRKCVIHGTSYGQGLTEIRRHVIKRQGGEPPAEPVPAMGSKKTPMVNFIDSQLENDLKTATKEKKRALVDFFLHLSINHTVLPEVFDSGTVVYSASSPDEGALVYGAKHFGFEFLSRPTQNVLHIDLPDDLGGALEVELLATMEFTSDRKRSSVLVRFKHPCLGKEVFYVFTKGADTTVRPLIVANGDKGATNGATNSELEQAQVFLEDFAVDGLRTLLLAGRVVGSDECKEWLEEWNASNQTMVDRETKVAECAEKLERDLELHGITGVEDRLQEEVSETIELLQKAGMKVWMLTGDKVATAINIGIATGLVSPFPTDGTRPIFCWDDFVKEALQKNTSPGNVARDHFSKCQQHVRLHGDGCFDAIVLDGSTLSVLLRNPDGFVEVMKGANSVLCCRVSPDQKGQIVRLFKGNCKKTTLAIGDGANDCNMIRSAHIGIGIRGEEGLQAFNVSDFGIGQFKFLSDLCIVNGRQYYRRQSYLIVYFFYKNAFVVIPQLMLSCTAIRCAGTRLYPDIVFQLYNVMYTALPILAYCTFDKDLATREECFKYAELYKLGPTHYYLNAKRVALWVCNAFWHSFLLFLIVFLAVHGSVVRQDGLMQDLSYTGVIVFNTVLSVVTLRLLLDSYFCTWVLCIFLLMTLAATVITPLLFDFVSAIGFETYGSYRFTMSSGQTYVILVTTLSALLLVDVYWKVIEYNYYPTPIQKITRKQRQLNQDVKIVVAPNAGSARSSGHTNDTTTAYTDAFPDRGTISSISNFGRVSEAVDVPIIPP